MLVQADPVVFKGTWLKLPRAIWFILEANGMLTATSDSVPEALPLQLWALLALNKYFGSVPPELNHPVTSVEIQWVWFLFGTASQPSGSVNKEEEEEEERYKEEG